MNTAIDTSVLDQLSDDEFQELVDEFRPQFLDIVRNRIQTVFEGAYLKPVSNLLQYIQDGCALFGLDFEQTLYTESEPFYQQLQADLENA